MTLERQLHCHLKLARRRCPIRPRQRRGRNAERTWRPSTIAGLVELRVIEDVKQLKPSLQLDSLRDAGPLGQCHVKIRISRTVELIASEIAGSVVARIRESAVADAGKGLGGNTGIQRGASDRATGEVSRVTDQFGSIAQARMLRVARAPDIIGMAGLEARDSRQLKTFHDSA